MADNCIETMGCAVDTIEKSAMELVNPASGLANDFLNHFNEILLLIENLPILLPEMLDDLLQWRAQTYEEYFKSSNLPGSQITLEIYSSLSSDFREMFEQRVGSLNVLAEEYIERILDARLADGSIDIDKISQFSEAAAPKLRSALADLADIVNGDGDPQRRADHLMGGFAS